MTLLVIVALLALLAFVIGIVAEGVIWLLGVGAILAVVVVALAVSQFLSSNPDRPHGRAARRG